MNQALDLYRLQKIDSRRDQISARLSEIDRILSEDRDLQDAQKNYNHAEQELQKARQTLKKAENAVQTQQIKIEQDTTNLYSGRIRNPKELQDLQLEISTLKKYLIILEDQQLDAMIALEKAETLCDEAKKNQQSVQAKSLDAHSILRGEQYKLEKEVERLNTERVTIINPLSPDIRKLYDRLREQKRGLAVATVHDASCDACGATLTPAEMQIARSPSQISFCQTCGRIIYAG